MKQLLTVGLVNLLLLSTNLIALDLNSPPEKLSAHYIASPQTLSQVKENLIKNGFKVLAITNILEGHDVITITNEELQATNSYMATLQISVNKEHIRIQNPSYLGAAYLGDSYSYGKFKTTLNALEATLGELIESKQKANFSDLKEYNFMIGMPKFNDSITIVEGQDLTSRVGETNRKIAYRLHLPNGDTLVGHKLEETTNSFLKTLGEEKNAQILPYKSMVYANSVQILDPKYYLALSLPLLSMGEFMEIASIPDQIEKEIKKAYR